MKKTKFKNSGSPTSRIFTTSLQLDAEYFNFPQDLYDDLSRNDDLAEYGKTGKERLNYGYLGVHYEKNSEGVNVEVIDPASYLQVITNLIRNKIDDKATVYGIVHDSDTKLDHGTIVPKTTHLHVLIHTSRPVRLNAVAKMIGVLPSLVETGKVRGRYAYDSALAYLVHALDPNKYQYDPEKVINGTEDEPAYVDLYAEKKETWRKRAADRKAERQQTDFERVRQAVMLGEYTREDLVGAEDEDLYMLYVRNKQALDDARSAYLDRQFIKYNRAIDKGTLQLQSLFVTGPAGTGKTRLAKTIAEGVCDLSETGKDKWRVFQAAPSNPFDDYDGEQIILLDDVRATSLRSASDWLKLMDPHNNGKTSARYHNASPMPRLIIITATETPHEFFSYVKSASDNEPLDQFLRRIQWTARVVGVDEVTMGSVMELPESVTKELIPERIVARHTSQRSGRSETYKPGREKTFKYVYGDRATGNFEEAAQAMISYYADYYNIGKSPIKSDLSLDSEPTSMLPITHDGDKCNLQRFTKPSGEYDGDIAKKAKMVIDEMSNDD